MTTGAAPSLEPPEPGTERPGGAEPEGRLRKRRSGPSRLRAVRTPYAAAGELGGPANPAPAPAPVTTPARPPSKFDSGNFSFHSPDAPPPPPSPPTPPPPTPPPQKTPSPQKRPDSPAEPWAPLGRNCGLRLLPARRRADVRVLRQDPDDESFGCNEEEDVRPTQSACPACGFGARRAAPGSSAARHWPTTGLFL